MNSSGNLKAFRKVLGWIAVAALSIHLMLCLILLIPPKHGLVRTTIGKIYNFYILLGPFFKEERIQSSTHFYARNYGDGEWKDYTDLTDTFFKGYLRQPWKYHRLILRNYTGNLSSDFVDRLRNKDIETVKDSHSFKRLHQFVATALPDVGASDSVQWISIVKWYNASSNTMKLDTLFDVKYYHGVYNEKEFDKID